MADLKISELGSLAGGDLVAGDELAIVDGSASETKKIGVGDLIENGVTLISDDAIPGAKILFAAGDIVTADLADSAVTTAKVNDGAITAAKLANESTVNLVTTLPAAGEFTGQLALDTDDNALYVYNGSAWVAVEGGITDVDGSTAGIVNIVSTIASGTATISATLDDTTTAAQFLAGPVGTAGAVGYRAIDGGDLPVATTTSKGGVIVNGNGLQMNGNVIEVANSVTASSVRHLVSYDANGLITGGAAIAAGDLPIATTSTAGAVIVSDGLAVDASGNLSVDNTVTAGEYTKVTVTERGLVSSGAALDADDIPDHSAAKLTSGTIGSSLIAADAITGAKLADQSVTKFGGALGSDRVTIFPAGDFKGQFFYDETTQDLYVYTGSSFVAVTLLSGNLVNAGAYNASTNQMSAVTSAGSAAGFSVGNALPAPAGTNLNHYVVVDTSGTGSGAAPAVALAPPDMLLSQGVGTEYSLIDVSNAIAGQTAANISLIATGDIVATDVQAAITELDTEKLPKAGGTMTGDLELNNADIVFEGSTADDYETTLTCVDPTADRTLSLPNVTGTLVSTGDSGTVTSTMILDGTIANADISSSAEIAVSKLANGTARQLLQTNAGGTAPEFTSNIDVPGTLDVTGAATLDSTLTVTGLISADGKVSFPAGTAAAPSLYSGSDTDTGIYSPGSNRFGITTNGTHALVIDASQFVGIGTTTADSRFHVDAASDSTVAKFETNSTTARIFITGGGSGNGLSLVDDDGNISFRLGLTDEKMRIDSSGNVGIGTTSPGKLLSLQDSSTPALGFYTGSTLRAEINATSAETSILSYANSPITFNIGGSAETEALRIDSSGRLLMGSSVAGNTDADNINIAGAGNVGITLRGSSTGTGNIFFADSTSGDDLKRGQVVYNHSDNSMGLYTNATEKLRIDSSGNVGIGESNPVSRLIIKNTSSNDGIRVISSTTGEGFVLFGDTDDNNTGGIVYNHTNDALEILVNNSERMRIDSSGNVGIGATSPGKLLSLQDSSTPALGFYTGSTLRAEINATSAETSVLSYANSPITFNIGGSAETEALRIDSSGNVGINTSSPGHKLVVKGTAAFEATNSTNAWLAYAYTDNTLRLNYNGAGADEVIIDSSGRIEYSHNTYLTAKDSAGTGYVELVKASTSNETVIANNKNAGIVFVNTNTSELARIDSSGRLLVGTDSARQTGSGFTAHSQVEGGATVSSSSFTITSNRSVDDLGPRLNFARSKGGSTGSNTSVDADAEYGGIYFFGADGTDTDSIGAQISAYVDGTPGSNDMPGRLVFSTTADGASSPTERMRIDSDGRANFFSGDNVIGAKTDDAAGTSTRLFFGSHTATSAVVGGTISFTVFSNGNVQNTNNSYGAISDAKLKENIVDASSQWDDIKDLRVRNYNFIEGQTHTQIGVVAQEVETVSPGLVTESPDRDEEGNDLGTTTKSVNYSVLYMKAVKALQEAMERIETLETKVAALEAGN